MPFSELDNNRLGTTNAFSITNHTIPNSYGNTEGKANGRIDLMNTDTIPFALYERVPNNACKQRKRIFGHLPCHDNPVKTAFFSESNMDTLQQAIISGIYNKSDGNWRIGNQDCDTLTVIMRGIFLQNSLNMHTNIPEQVEALNKLVLDYAVPQVYNSIDAHLSYKRDVSTLAVPIDRPVSTYSHHKSMEFKGWFSSPQ